MRILIYHGKHADDYFLVDTQERENAALAILFKMLDEYGCYGDDEEDIVEARAGDPRAIKWVLERRSRGYEYEEWEIVEPIDPLDEKYDT